MKSLLGLLIVTALFSGCASNSTKATEYCDANWSGRYDTWQSCYDRQLGEQNKARHAAGAFLKGYSDGLKSANQNNIQCTTIGNQTNCHN